MTWCSHCGKNCNTSRENNFISCVHCGKVLFEDIYTEEATFVDDAAGGAGLRSSFLRIESTCLKSQRRSLQKGKVSTSELICNNRSTNVSHAARQYKRREMIWCSNCARKSGTAHDHTTGSVCCVDCGKILFEDIYTKKATFFKGEAGRSIRINGSYAIVKEDTEELDDEMEELTTEDEEEHYYSKTKSHEWRSNYNKQESYDDDYDYDYDGGDETDNS